MILCKVFPKVCISDDLRFPKNKNHFECYDCWFVVLAAIYYKPENMLNFSA